MYKKKCLLIGLPAVLIILQTLPKGVVLNFANPEGSSYRHTYSYFSLTPFGYANFGPFITAVLTCLILLLSVILVFKYSKTIRNILSIVCEVAIFTSLMPLIYGIDYVTLIGILNTIILVLELCVIFNYKE